MPQETNARHVCEEEQDALVRPFSLFETTRVHGVGTSTAVIGMVITAVRAEGNHFGVG